MTIFKSSSIASFLSVSSLYLAVVLNACLAFGFQVILARQLPPDAYGELVTVLAVITLLAALSSAGVPGFLLRIFGAEQHQAVRWLPITIQLIAISWLTFTLMLWAWAIWGPNDDLTQWLFLILSPILLSQIMIELINTKFQLEHRYHFLSLWQFIQNLLRFTVVLVLVTTLSYFTIETAALALMGGSFICISISLQPLRRFFQGKLSLYAEGYSSGSEGKIKTVSMRDAAYQSFPFALSGLLYIIYFQSDIILLKYLDSAISAGIYNIAFTIMAAVYLFPNVLFQKYLLPKLHRWNAHNKSKLASTYKLACSTMFLVGFITMIFLWLLAPPLIIQAFGSEYQQAILYVNILALCVPLRFLSSSVASRLLSHRDMQLKVICMGGAAILNLVLNFLFIPEYGATAAAVTTVLSEGLLLILFLLAVAKQDKTGVEH